MAPPEKVYLVFHDFYSHDMFVVASAKTGNPKLQGVYTTREEAERHIRPGMDDYIVEQEVQHG